MYVVWDAPGHLSNAEWWLLLSNEAIIIIYLCGSIGTVYLTLKYTDDIRVHATEKIERFFVDIRFSKFWDYILSGEPLESDTINLKCDVLHEEFRIRIFHWWTHTHTHTHHIQPTYLPLHGVVGQGWQKNMTTHSYYANIQAVEWQATKSFGATGWGQILQ